MPFLGDFIFLEDITTDIKYFFATEARNHRIFFPLIYHSRIKMFFATEAQKHRIFFVGKQVAGLGTNENNFL